MSHNEALKYVPPAGIDVNFLEWFPSKNQVVIEFLCSDLQPDPILRKSLKDIHHELLSSDYFKDRVLQRNLGSHRNSSRRGMMVEINLSNPMIREAPAEIRRAAEEATDVHDVVYDPEEIKNAVVESSYEFADGYTPRSGDGGFGRYKRKLKYPEPEPSDVVQERFYRQTGGPEQELVEEYGPEKWKYRMGVIDIG